jgi:predicted NACHT family NTPase
MARRSLKASAAGIKRAKLAFERKGWTQEYLAGEVGIETRQPIWKFFAGKPVDRHVFGEICFRLDLDPEDIVAPPEVSLEEIAATPQDVPSDLNALVNSIRQKRHEKIQDQCGTLRLLDIARPVGLDDLYVEVNILEEITSQRWLGISDLQGFQAEEFDRLGLGKVRQEQVPGLKAVERYPKLMVLGKPGAGKTTFLQHLAILCDRGEFQADRVPIFIRLKSFAEDAEDEGNFSLLDYLNRDFADSGVSEAEVETLLNEGRVLLLLDGLDEVPEAVSDEVIKQIRKLSDKYYKSQLIITCRIAAQEYRFRGFTEVEIADFKPRQIEIFAKKWFVAVARNSPEVGLEKASAFLEQMALPENQPIRELAKTPVLLNLTCLVFEAKAEFPAKRSELYKQGLDLLLTRWDETRGIRRDEAYRNLSLPRKLQLLSRLAATTFERGDYFFEEEAIQRLITDYLQNHSQSQTDSAALELDSFAILRSIEAQHGLLVERARRIYSFSHLTFQEYLTAREIVLGATISLPQLVDRLTEKRWREVILLTAQMLPTADELLRGIKGKLDTLVMGASDEKNTPLQQYLHWVEQKSLAVKTAYHPAAVRAFYFTLALPSDHRLAGDQGLALSIDPKLAGESGGELALDLALTHALNVALSLTPELICDRIMALRLALDLDHLTKEKAIGDSLKTLKGQLPHHNEEPERIKQWWQTCGGDWVSQLSGTLLEQRSLGHNWHWGEAWKQVVEEYVYGNQLLVDCLHCNCQLTPAVREDIEAQLFLPAIAR